MTSFATSHMYTLLILFTCIGAGLIGGVFFAFSTFVMKALTQLPPDQGVAAMQRINVVVLSPPFLGVFVGTALLGLICIGLACFAWGTTRSMLLLVAGVSYVIGCFGVTLVCNVPRNERLKQMQADSPAATQYWPAYVHEWLVWNHVRAAASTIAAALAAAALAY